MEKGKSDPWKLEAQPIREDQVENAVKFLSHPKVRTSPIVHRRSFLERKGLTREEIDESFRRVPVSYCLYSSLVWNLDIRWSLQHIMCGLMTV